MKSTAKRGTVARRSGMARGEAGDRRAQRGGVRQGQAPSAAGATRPSRRNAARLSAATSRSHAASQPNR